MKKLVQDKGESAMTKNLNEKLDETLAADFGEDYQAKHKAIRNIKHEMFDNLHDTQKEAIMETFKAMRPLLASYSEFIDPNFSEIRDLDSAFWRLYHAFSLEGVGSDD